LLSPDREQVLHLEAGIVSCPEVLLLVVAVQRLLELLLALVAASVCLCRNPIVGP